ncbi:MAG: SIMPL domain-containing protein [Caldisericia bacterium]|nr:SIMPL domain-containing protein [Caldisericia bacterium]NLI56046.1 SIMPL domain-containing protein [bacterium]HQJ56822.1 SIMPL domain-containing protein [Caldisericia bacterium]
MKKVLTLFLVSVLILVVSLMGISFAKTDVNEVTDVTSENSITVSGQGIVYAKPDVGYVNVGVEIQRLTAKEASEENAKIMNQIVSALLKLGVKEDDLTTLDYSIQPVYNYPEKEAPVLVGYMVRNNLSIKITKKLANGDLDTGFLSEVLDAATSNGANVISGLSFDISNKDELKLEAIKLAMEDAKKKAEAALEVVDEKIKGVAEINISDVYYPVYRDVKNITSEMQTPIFTGTESVQVTVNVKFIF